MENLYDILQIASDVDDREIKKAYVRMLRKYPPEKAPEEFKKIRGAYERLSDPISRKEYDAVSNYQDEIEELCRQGEEALETEAYDVAIKVYKKILIIEPTLAFAKNRLGMALTYNNELDEAIVQLEEVIKINPKNTTYYSNLGYVYRMKGDNKQAEIALQKAYKLDNFNDSAIVELAELYVAQDDLQKAVLFLRQCIEQSNKTEDRFQVFIYYFKILEFYIVEDNQPKIFQTLEEIEICVLEDEEVREYVAWKLAKFAYTFYELKLYKLTETLVEKARSLNDDDETIEELYNQTREINQSNELYKKLDADDRIVAPLKGPILYYLYGDEIESEEKLKELVNKNLEAIHTYILYEPEQTIKGIEILKKDYLMLYKYREELFDNIYTKAKNIHRHEKLENDKNKLNNYENNSDNGGCGVIFICAIIGGLLLPGIGLFIGAFIGYKLTQ